MLEDIYLSEKDIETILVTHQEILDIDPEKYLFIGHVLKTLLRSYVNVKKVFFENNQDTLYLEIDTLLTEAAEIKNTIPKLESVIQQQEQE